jgi:polysaccharide export outer membrane protein
MPIKVIFFSLFAVASLAIAQNSPREGLQPTPKSAADRYVLGVDDQIVVHAANVPDISDKPIRLDDSGAINLPMIGRVRAVGVTAEELETELKNRLKTYLEHPDVVVSVSEFHTQPVSVIGEVGTPGVQQVRGPKSLVEVLSMAGGPRSDAGPTLLITRHLTWGRVPLPGAADDPTGTFSIAQVNLKSLLNARDPGDNIAVRPYDVISIPRAENVYLVGQVGKVGSLALSDNQTISVLQAISSSGGLLPNAAPRNAKILRPILGGPRRAELDVDIKKILEGKASDVPLLPGDILLVPASTGYRAGVRALEAALQIGSMAAIYGIVR